MCRILLRVVNTYDVILMMFSLTQLYKWLKNTASIIQKHKIQENRFHMKTCERSVYHNLAKMGRLVSFALVTQRVEKENFEFTTAVLRLKTNLFVTSMKESFAVVTFKIRTKKKKSFSCGK